MKRHSIFKTLFSAIVGIAVLLFVCPTVLSAQDGYKKMFTPGKKWRVAMGGGSGLDGWYHDPYWLIVGPDTVVHGVKCSQIILDETDSRYTTKPDRFLVVEDVENRKVYDVYDHGEKLDSALVFDFSLKVGDKVPECETYPNHYCLKIDSIMVKGEIYRRFHLGTEGTKDVYKTDIDPMIWVEGIGTYDKFKKLGARRQIVVTDGNKVPFISCYENDNCIFEYVDFFTGFPWAEEILDIKDKPKAPTDNALMFDLQGRQLKSAPQKGIYIQNGKKVLAK